MEALGPCSWRSPPRCACCCGPGWTILKDSHVIDHVSSIQSDTAVTIGVPDAPSSIDIRTDDNPAIEQALLGNVYETLVARGQDNSLTAGLAKQWDVSEDGLTYTFTLQSGLRFSNGHALDSSDVVWSLQQAVQQQYVGSEALDHLAEVAQSGQGHRHHHAVLPRPDAAPDPGRTRRHRLR